MEFLAFNFVRAYFYIGPLAMSIFLVFGILYMLPGKKGKVAIERIKFYQGLDVGELRKLIRNRLKADNFKFEEAQDDPMEFSARRLTHRPPQSPMSVYPFPKLKLEIQVELLPHQNGAQARFQIRNLDSLANDSGEVEYMEAMLDFLSGEEAPRHVQPSLHSLLLSAPLLGIQAMIYPWIAVIIDVGGHFDDFISGSFLTAAAGVSLAIYGMIEIAVHPTWYRGYLIGAAAILLGLLGASSAAFVKFFL